MKKEINLVIDDFIIGEKMVYIDEIDHFIMNVTKTGDTIIKLDLIKSKISLKFIATYDITDPKNKKTMLAQMVSQISNKHCKSVSVSLMTSDTLRISASTFDILKH